MEPLERVLFGYYMVLLERSGGVRSPALAMANKRISHSMPNLYPDQYRDFRELFGPYLAANPPVGIRDNLKVAAAVLDGVADQMHPETKKVRVNRPKGKKNEADPTAD